MEIARKSYCAVNSFVSSVIEWRSPAAAPYFMFINSAFWWGVFYLNKEIQLQLLVSLAATIFGWDILLSPTYERSILLHILTWPLRNLLRTVSVIMVLCSAQFLYRSELEKACWTAYTAVLLGKIKKALLKITAVIRDTCDAAVMKLYTAKDAVLNIINSTLGSQERNSVCGSNCKERNSIYSHEYMEWNNFYNRGIQKWSIICISDMNTFCAVIRFLQYWLCAHWWPSLKSWFLLNVMTRLQMFFNYICFGIVYVTCGYWINPFIAFLSKHLVNFYDYLQRFIINPLERWIQCQFNKAVVCMRQMLHNLAIAVRDSILWPFFLLLLSLVNKICAYFYRIFLQPIIDILYERYKVCEDYLLIYFLGPVCQVFVDHIPERSPFCDDTDTELADLLPPGFNDGEESDTETSDKPSLPSRSLSPLTEDEHDFVCGLKFPNVDTSDSSEAEFALKPKSKPRIMMRKKEKVHPKDPAPSVCSDDLDSIVHESQGNKDKRSHSSSGSSYSESVISSSAQNAWNDADLQNFGEFNFELEDRLKSEFLGGVVEVRESNERPKERKQHASQKIGEIEGCDTRHAAASTDGLDGSFEAGLLGMWMFWTNAVLENSVAVSVGLIRFSYLLLLLKHNMPIPKKIPVKTWPLKRNAQQATDSKIPNLRQDSRDKDLQELEREF
uniref:Uncharacterized protein n=1 Tax=Setaria digitata TaxID=48799 RepID=A0A915PQ06_9BILA